MSVITAVLRRGGVWEHLVVADVVVSHVVDVRAGIAEDLQRAGLRTYRVELLEEDRDESLHIISAYQKLLRGMRTGETLWRDLRAHSQLGVTSGTLVGE